MMRNKKTENKKIEYSKKISVKEGCASVLMDSFGSRYITPYALALGAANIFIALMSSLPSLIGNISQIYTLKLMKSNSRKKIVFGFVLTQAILWLPIIGLGIFYMFSKNSLTLIPLLLLIFYSFMVISGSMASPAWNSWMKDLVKKESGNYFGKRNMIINSIGILGVLIAGIILYFFKENKVLLGFFIIFSIAFLGRLMSAYFFTRKYEPKYVYDPKSYFSLKDFLGKMEYNNFGRFVIFISIVSFTTAIASPFFAVYMLKNLQFSYINFTLVTLGSYITTIFFLPVWGKFADKFGNIKVLKITGWLIPLIPIFWILTLLITPMNNLYLLVFYLILVEFLSGFIWSGFNLSTSNFIYDAVTREKMAFCVSYFNILNAFGIFLGALMGGLIASKNVIFGIDSIIILFIISGILRFIPIIIFKNLIKEVRNVPEFDVEEHIKDKLDIFRYFKT